MYSYLQYYKKRQPRVPPELRELADAGGGGRTPASLDSFPASFGSHFVRWTLTVAEFSTATLFHWNQSAL